LRLEAEGSCSYVALFRKTGDLFHRAFESLGVSQDYRVTPLDNQIQAVNLHWFEIKKQRGILNCGSQGLKRGVESGRSWRDRVFAVITRQRAMGSQEAAKRFKGPSFASSPSFEFAAFNQDLCDVLRCDTTNRANQRAKQGRAGADPRDLLRVNGRHVKPIGGVALGACA